MRIYELLWLLLLLFPVSVDPESVTNCPNGCSRDGQTLLCLDITNKDLKVLYACINSSPEITVVDLRSKLECDCDLLYLTNHHVNKDLLVFAPVECPPSMPVNCGMRPSENHDHNEEIEIAGKMFSVKEDELQGHLNNHITTLVQKLSKITDPKKRLEYLSAVYFNTQNAIDRINQGGAAKTKVEIPNPQLYTEVTTSTTPALSTEITTKPQPVSGGENVSQDPKLAQLNVNLKVNPIDEGVIDEDLEESQYHFKPYIADTKKLIKSILHPKPLPTKPATTTDTPKSTTSTTSTEQPMSVILAPLINFLKAGNFKTIEVKKSPEYHIQKEISGWEHLVTDKSMTSTLENKQDPNYIKEHDHRTKMIIFGSIIVFIVFVIICVLVAMTTRRRKTSNKPSKGDLEVSSYWGDKTVWKKLKGTVQTEYVRRESDEDRSPPASSVIFNSCDFPRSNLINMKKTGGGVAVSGLTAAIPQQPVMRHGIPIAPPLKLSKKETPLTQEVHTRLLYKSGLYPGISSDSLNVFERARPSSMLHDKHADDRAGTSTSAAARKRDGERSPGRDASSVSSDESLDLDKKLVLLNHGQKSSYTVNEDVKGTVKVYQPAKFTGDMVSGGTSLHMQDQKYVDVLNTRMSYADREKARIARKKRLMRVQMFTG